jgi:hypothetical protein
VATSFQPYTLSTAQTGNFTTPAVTANYHNTADGGGILITSAIGATPTVTANIQGSIDGVNFFNIPYSLVATPRTFVVTAITITTAVTTTYILQENVPWQQVRVAYTANTNVTLTTTAYL